MDLIKKLIELAYYYRQDEASGKPYWCDPTVIALVVSLIATALLKWAGMNLDADLQLKIVGVITGIGALLSPHSGVVKKTPVIKPAPDPGPGAKAGTRADDRHNLSSLS